MSWLNRRTSSLWSWHRWIMTDCAHTHSWIECWCKLVTFLRLRDEVKAFINSFPSISSLLQLLKYLLWLKLLTSICTVLFRLYLYFLSLWKQGKVEYPHRLLLSLHFLSLLYLLMYPLVYTLQQRSHLILQRLLDSIQHSTLHQKTILSSVYWSEFLLLDYCFFENIFSWVRRLRSMRISGVEWL